MTMRTAAIQKATRDQMPGLKLVKAARLRPALQIAALLIALPAAGYAETAQERAGYCKNCHGESGQGFHGYYTAPRLAGQQVQYILNAFKALADHSRDDPLAKQFMYPAEASVEPRLWKGLAQYFSRLEAAPAANGPKHLVSTGKKIYEEGVPSQNVPACAACHGPDAKGTDAIPRLAGQQYSYLVDQLIGWSKGYRSKDPASPRDTNAMVPFATSLTKEQISAVAAYLSYQR
jgi:cytochrome c553